MLYAPIIIPTLSRSTHFIRCIESLRRNTWAKYTDVYIGVDYPSADKYKAGHQTICEYLQGKFPEFKSMNIIYRESNMGASQNVDDMRKTILTQYDRFIYAEDDIEFAPNFLEYIDTCLTRYEDDPDVIAVSGYSYPLQWKTSEGATIFREDFICPAWGTGYWTQKHQDIRTYMESGGLAHEYHRVRKTKAFKRMLQSSKKEYVNVCLYENCTSELVRRTTDISMRMYSVIYNKYIITPVISKTRNWGMDGSGLYCKDNTNELHGNTAKTFNYSSQVIDNQNSFKCIEDTLCDIAYNKKLMDKFEAIPFTSRIKTNIKALIYRICKAK